MANISDGECKKNFAHEREPLSSGTPTVMFGAGGQTRSSTPQPVNGTENEREVPISNINLRKDVKTEVRNDAQNKSKNEIQEGVNTNEEYTSEDTQGIINTLTSPFRLFRKLFVGTNEHTMSEVMEELEKEAEKEQEKNRKMREDLEKNRKIREDLEERTQADWLYRRKQVERNRVNEETIQRLMREKAEIMERNRVNEETIAKMKRSPKNFSVRNSVPNAYHHKDNKNHVGSNYVGSHQFNQVDDMLGDKENIGRSLILSGTVSGSSTQRSHAGFIKPSEMKSSPILKNRDRKSCRIFLKQLREYEEWVNYMLRNGFSIISKRIKEMIHTSLSDAMAYREFEKPWCKVTDDELLEIIKYIAYHKIHTAKELFGTVEEEYCEVEHHIHIKDAQAQMDDLFQQFLRIYENSILDVDARQITYLLVNKIKYPSVKKHISDLLKTTTSFKILLKKRNPVVQNVVQLMQMITPLIRAHIREVHYSMHDSNIEDGSVENEKELSNQQMSDNNEDELNKDDRISCDKGNASDNNIHDSVVDS